MILMLESATSARNILVESFIPMRVELAFAPRFVVCQSHDVYTEKNLFRDCVKGSGMATSPSVSLAHRSCNHHLIFQPFVVLILIPLTLAAYLSSSLIKLSSSRKPMILYCIPLHSVRQFIWILQRFRGTSRVSTHIYGDTWDVSICD